MVKKQNKQLINETIDNDKPKIITIGNKEYYVGSELMEYDKVFFTGCSRTIRKIIELKKIHQDNYAYGNNNVKKGGWRLSDNQANPPPKANLLLSKDWVESNIPKMMNGLDEKEVKEKYDCPEAPNIIELEDNEKFKDEEGNPLEIETRGERSVDGIYFSICDIEKVFNMENIHKILTQSTSGYISGEHFCYFTCMDLIIKRSNTHKKGPSKGRRMFLTYEGMIKLLYCSRSPNAKKFRKWATETLFTVQMGDQKEKEKLASGLIGIPIKSLKQVLSKSVNSVPCIYRFALGKCKDLRDSMKISKEIPDEYVIIKYGYTDDLERRTNEHIKTYNSIKGVKLELMNYIYVDPKYLSEAESTVRDFFKSFEKPIEYEKFAELVAINPANEKTIMKHFKMIGTTYAGCVSQIVSQITDLKREVELLKEKNRADNEKHRADTEKHKAELIERDSKIKLMEKDMEIMQLKMILGKK
jgi:FtsZ-binding cell division protein ZapB